MALSQAHQTDSYLEKVGLDGFSLLDEYYDKSGSSSTRSNYHQYHNNNEFRWPKKPGTAFDVHHHSTEYRYGRFQDGPQYWSGEPVIDCNLAAQLYGGKVIVDHGKGPKGNKIFRKGYY